MATTTYMNSTNFKNYTKFYQENNLALDDDIIIVSDIPTEDMSDMNRLIDLDKKLYPTEAERTEMTDLKVKLAPYMATADKINKLSAMVYGMEVYLKEGVVIFFNQQKQEIIDIMNNHRYIGIYSPLTIYKQGNMVLFDGYGFVSKVDNNVGHAPDKELMENDYWFRLTIKGDKGDPSLNISIKKGTDGTANYDATITYNVGDACVYNNRLYYAKADGIIGFTPSDRDKWSCVDNFWIDSIAPTDTYMVWFDITNNTIKRYSENNVWVASTLDGKTAIGALLTNEKVNLVNAINELKNTIDNINTNLTNNKIDKTDFVSKNSYAVTTGTSTSYIVSTNPNPTSYVDGMQITIKPHIDCGVNPTLNWNGLGALTILNQDGTSINASDIKANKPLSLVRVGSSFFMINSKKGKRTASGNATLSATSILITRIDGLQSESPYITVTGLNFKPSVVIIQSSRCIVAYSEMSSAPYVKTYSFQYYGNETGDLFKGDVFGVSVTSNGFTLPCDDAFSTSVNWIAYE